MIGPTPEKWPKRARPASAAWPSRWKSPPRPEQFCVRHKGNRSPAKRVLITAGPTHEPIDPVRYIATAPPASKVLPSRLRRKSPAPMWC